MILFVFAKSYFKLINLIYINCYSVLGQSLELWFWIWSHGQIRIINAHGSRLIFESLNGQILTNQFAEA
jgi:hypothetical protein